MNLTPEQQAAIVARNPILLVSAAAGSGKTAVLIQRALDLITSDGLSVSRMLIVTFTRAAAGEMRQRLESALQARAADEPALRRELGRVDSAQISTIHVFCQKLIHEFFQACDAPPDAQQLDEPTGVRLQEQAMNEILDEAFDSQSPDMISLSQKFRDDQIISLIQKLYLFVMARPDPLKWLEAQSNRDFSTSDIESGAIAAELLQESRLLIDGFSGLIDRALTLAAEPLFPDKLRELARMDGQTAQALKAACEQGLAPLRQAIQAASFPGQVRVSPKATPEEVSYKERFGLLRSSYKDLFKKLEDFVPANIGQAAADMRAMQPATRALCQLCAAFIARYGEKKRELGAVDFTDLEHMGLQILRVPELREQIASRFDAIFVDEYQDVSGIQESLLSALYGGVKSVFLVGDVKQSIYRFRQADPTLFMDKEARFSMDADARERKIILNRNFRSREGVLSAVNTVFERVMRRDATEIEYDDAARLYAGTPSQNDPQTELHLFPSPTRRSMDTIATEARETAKRILDLVNTPLYTREGEPDRLLTFRDFAILLPKSRNVASVVERELTRAGVPVYTEDSGGSLGENEITQALCALKLMDNRFDDLSLLSVLRGPVFRFTEGELADVRLTLPDKNASFLDAMIETAKQSSPLGARCQQALTALERERFLQNAMPLDEYLWDYLERSGLYAFYGGMDGGRLRQANLRMLCFKAGEAVKRGYDLSGFIQQVTGVSAAQDKTSPSVLSPWENVVRVMTMHKSKGLEFPVVILMGLSDKLSKDFGESRLQLHPRLGLSLNYINEDMRTTRQTLLGALIKRVQVREEKSERARLLYVAMTRARDKLIMMGHTRAGELPDSWTLPNTAMRVAEASTMVDWLGQTACDEGWLSENPNVFPMLSTSFPQKKAAWTVVIHNEATENPQGTDIPTPAARTWQEGLLQNALTISAASKDKPAPELLTDAPRRTDAQRIPFKLGVTALVKQMTQLEQAIDDPEETALDKAVPLTPARASLLSELPPAPECLTPKKSAATGAEKGTATHHALSLIPLDDMAGDMTPIDRLTRVHQALDRLEGRHVMTKAERGLIDEGAIAAFFASPYGQRLLKAQSPKREWSFNLRDESLSPSVLQGVIDLCFVEGGQWVLLDYKTDRVSAVGELKQRYQRQIAIYKRALEVITGLPVKEAALYSLRLGGAVTL